MDTLGPVTVVGSSGRSIMDMESKKEELLKMAEYSMF